MLTFLSLFSNLILYSSLQVNSLPTTHHLAKHLAPPNTSFLPFPPDDNHGQGALNPVIPIDGSVPTFYSTPTVSSTEQTLARLNPLLIINLTIEWSPAAYVQSLQTNPNHNLGVVTFKNLLDEVITVKRAVQKFAQRTKLPYQDEHGIKRLPAAILSLGPLSLYKHYQQQLQQALIHTIEEFENRESLEDDMQQGTTSAQYQYIQLLAKQLSFGYITGGNFVAALASQCQGSWSIKQRCLVDSLSDYIYLQAVELLVDQSLQEIMHQANASLQLMEKLLETEGAEEYPLIQQISLNIDHLQVFLDDYNHLAIVLNQLHQKTNYRLP